MNGILPLWKEKGMTSHDAVYKLRKILGTKKVGHTGTLDPSVEGVLPMCIGEATRVAEYITNAGKEYIAVVSIGTATETEDADGATVAFDETFKQFKRSDIENVLDKLTGEIIQIPPMFSAVKVGGRRLYEYARKGIVVDRPERTVIIEKLELLDDAETYEGIEISFKLRIICSKGTYIRTLAVQIGEILGYPAHMVSLVRTASGNYRKEDCRTLAEIAMMKKESTLDDFIQPLESVLENFRFLEIEDDMHFDIINGQVLPRHPLFEDDETPIVFTQNNKALAVYQIHPTKPLLMKPEKMFPENS